MTGLSCPGFLLLLILMALFSTLYRLELACLARWGAGLLLASTGACIRYDADLAEDDPVSGGPTRTGEETAASGDLDQFPIYSAGNQGGSAGMGGALAGEESACLRLLSLGKVATGGAVPGEGGLDAVVAWLNRVSNVSAEHRIEPEEIGEELLSSVDVLLLQDLGQWNPSSDESHALMEWVSEGGAVIALSGYEGGGETVAVTNGLLSFSGLNFAVTSTDTSTALGDCGYCLGSSRKVTTFDPGHPISNHIDAVGAFLGRSVKGHGDLVVGDAAVQLGVTRNIENGRVFFYHDDWVTYVPLWTGEMSFFCDTNPSCSDESPSVSYQVAQFWYNTLSWAVPSKSCLSIDDPSIKP